MEFGDFTMRFKLAGTCQVDQSSLTWAIVLLVLSLLVLVPLSAFGIRKWCAYQELLRQYDQLRMDAGGNDFPSGADDFPVVSV